MSKKELPNFTDIMMFRESCAIEGNQYTIELWKTDPAAFIREMIRLYETYDEY